jgi:hypothetical protein
MSIKKVDKRKTFIVTAKQANVFQTIVRANNITEAVDIVKKDQKKSDPKTEWKIDTGNWSDSDTAFYDFKVSAEPRRKMDFGRTIWRP